MFLLVLVVRVSDAADRPTLYAQIESYEKIEFSPDGMLMGKINLNSGALTFFETSSGRIVNKVSTDLSAPFGQWCFTKDSSSVSTFNGETVSFFDPLTGETQARFRVDAVVMHCAQGLGLSYFDSAHNAHYLVVNTLNGYGEERVPGGDDVFTNVFISDDRQSWILATPIRNSEQSPRPVQIEIYARSGERIARANHTLPIDSDILTKDALALDSRSLHLYYLEPRKTKKHTLETLSEPRKIGIYDLRLMRKLYPNWLKDLEATEIRMVTGGMLVVNNGRINRWKLYDTETGSIVLQGDGLVAGVDATTPRNRLLVTPNGKKPYMVAIPSLQKTPLIMFEQQPVSAMHAVGEHVWITAAHQLRYMNLQDLDAQTVLDEPHDIAALERGEGRILVLLTGKQRKAQLVVISPDRARTYIDLPAPYVPIGNAVRVNSGWLLPAISKSDNDKILETIDDDINHIAYGQDHASKLEKNIITAYCHISDSGRVTVLDKREGVPDQIVFASRARTVIVIEGRLLRFLNWPSLEIYQEIVLNNDYDKIAVSPSGQSLILKGHNSLEARSIKTGELLSKYDADLGVGDVLAKDDSHAYVTTGRTLFEWNFGATDSDEGSYDKPALTNHPFADSHIREKGGIFFMESPPPNLHSVRVAGECVRPIRWSKNFGKLLCQAENVVPNRKSYAVFNRENGRKITTLTNFGLDSSLPIFTPDEQSVLYVRQDKTPPAAGEFISTFSYRLISRDLTSGAETVLLNDTKNLILNFYSRSGDYLLIVEMNPDELMARQKAFTFKILNASTGTFVASFERSGLDFPKATVADDGDTVLVVDAGELSQYSAKGGGQPRWVQSIPHVVGAALTEGDLQVLTFASEGQSPRLFNTDSGEELKSFSLLPKDMLNPMEKKRIRVLREDEKAPGGDRGRTAASSFRILFTDDEELYAVRSLEKHVMLLRADGQMNLYDPLTGSAKARVVVMEGGGWVVVASDGRFDASNMDDVSVLHWVRPDASAKTFPVETYLLNLYEPQLIWKLLSGTALPAPNLIGIETELPYVESIAIEPQSADTVNVVVRVNDPTASRQSVDKVASVKLFRDGRLVGLFRAPDDALQVRGSVEASFSGIRLRSGRPGDQVVFSAYAFNQGGFKGPTAVENFFRTEESTERKRRAYVISIGIDQYANSKFNLRYASRDAQAFFNQLSTILKTDDSIGEVISILMTSPVGHGANGGNILPTKENIRRTLTSIAGKVSTVEFSAPPPAHAIEGARPQDLVFVFFSGHGHMTSDGEFFMLPSDIDSTPADEKKMTPELLRSSISSADLARWLEGLDAAEVTMILDACHAAGAIEPNFRPGPLTSRGLGQLAYDKRMRILAGSQADSVSQEAGDLRHGYLTYALLVDGLEHRAADFNPSDGSIWLDEWLAYAKRRVPVLTKSTIHEPSGLSSNESSQFDAGGLATKPPSEKAIQRPVLFDFSRGSSTLRFKNNFSAIATTPLFSTEEP